MYMSCSYCLCNKINYCANIIGSFLYKKYISQFIEAMQHNIKCIIIILKIILMLKCTDVPNDQSCNSKD